MRASARYTEDQVREAVASARSLSEALRRLGLRPAGGNHATLRQLIADWSISTEHFDRNWGRRAGAGAPATPLEKVLVEGSTYHRGHLKERLLATGLKRPECELCGQGEMWRGLRIALILDHVNGLPTDQRLENLRIVCPNCAATLDTHCGRKNKRLPIERTCANCGAIFRPQYQRHRYCCSACGSRHDNRRRGPQPEQRKVARPSHDQLVADVHAMGFSATGRRYGVSDNAIRKWLRQYESERANGEP